MFLDSGRPLGVDLFAGVGGMSLGFEQAGFDVAAAVEIDPVHCAAHKFNFPRTTIIPKSVVGLRAADIRLAAGIGSRPIDCVFGGPPCQGFSLMGHRALEDPRNNLVLEFVRLVAELDARTFVFENVKGLTVGKHKSLLNELVTAFEEVGYEVRSPWQVLDAACYGVPQHRERLILFGVQKGRTLPNYPPMTCIPADEHPSSLESPHGPTTKDALGDLPDASRFDVLLSNDCHWTSSYGKQSQYAEYLRCVKSDSWHFGYIRDWNPSMLTSSARTLHSEISVRRFSETMPGEVEPISRFYRLSPNGLSNTLRAGTDSSRGAFTSPRPIHYKYPRCVTVREMARLHGFPDWFRFHSTKWHGARQIGNAVPPLLARAVAQSVLNSLGTKPNRPVQILSLGDDSLLYMDISDAASHFGVHPPKCRRDRTSGAKKRKQHEIEQFRLSPTVAYG